MWRGVRDKTYFLPLKAWVATVTGSLVMLFCRWGMWFCWMLSWGVEERSCLRSSTLKTPFQLKSSRRKKKEKNSRVHRETYQEWCFDSLKGSGVFLRTVTTWRYFLLNNEDGYIWHSLINFKYIIFIYLGS